MLNAVDPQFFGTMKLTKIASLSDRKKLTERTVERLGEACRPTSWGRTDPGFFNEVGER